MEFRCQDLPQHGLLLIPPSSADYEALLADILRRVDPPPDGAPPMPEDRRPRIVEADRLTSAILLNRSPKAIAALQAVWHFETETGRSFRHSRGMLSAQNLLLPFGRPEHSLKLYGYWHTILPGSKRYLGESGMVGNNTDVRPPAPDEKWGSGGGVSGSTSGGIPGGDPVKHITLVLDGVFFLDGEFVGPDRERLFDRTTADVEAHELVAKIARDGHNNGLSPAQIMAQIDKATGPPPEHPPHDLAFRNPDATPEEFRQAALQQLAYQFAMQRKFAKPTEERIVYSIMQWTETAVPHFRKS